MIYRSIIVCQIAGFELGTKLSVSKSKRLVRKLIRRYSFGSVTILKESLIDFLQSALETDISVA